MHNACRSAARKKNYDTEEINDAIRNFEVRRRNFPFHSQRRIYSQRGGRVALLAQWLERAAVNRKVTGSIPVGSVLYSRLLCERVHRRDQILRPRIELGTSRV
jgi:hypothetical protein